MKRSLVVTMGLAAGVTVASLYYNQPLLTELQRDYRCTVEQIGWIPTSTQLGYALAMLFLVPLGDMLERRKLILVMMGLTVATLLLFSASSSVTFGVAASLALGLVSVTPQLLIPFAAHMAAPRQRGRVVGSVMSGLLIGILLARTFSGFVGSALGWRAVYWIAAGIMAAMAVVLARMLPASHPDFKGSYLGLLRSIGRLVREQPVLRESSLIGAMLFGCFSVFWATLVFHLSTPPFHYGPRMAGLFGLFGAAGAMAAPVVGHFADRRDPRITVGLGIVIAILSFVLLFALRSSLAGLALGAVLMDLGVQAGHVSNQSRVFALVPEARSRLNTVYMFTYFIGGAAGSGLGGYAWSIAGWSGVCASALGLLAVALAVFTSSGLLRSGKTP